jgi:hypothetical protein
MVVQQEAAGLGGELAQILADLSWVHGDLHGQTPSLSLFVRQQGQQYRIPSTASRVFEADGFSGYEYGDECYLTDGTSQWHLHLRQGRGEAWLAPSFDALAARLRRSFWGFGVFKLLRPLGLFGLHAAGVISTSGVGLLIVGAPGSGKSTLALGLLRRGWGYLSDDAVLLRRGTDAVEALACRRDAYVNADDAWRYAPLPWGEEVLDDLGRSKRRLSLAATYPGQMAARCIPTVVLVARIVGTPRSTVRPLDRTHALRQLLSHSGPQLFDRWTMQTHVAVLTCLLEQAAVYELHAGLDLYEEPLRLSDLIGEVTGDVSWRG